MPSSEDTIVATSSPPGRSPRGLVRLSGYKTTDVLESLLVRDESVPQIRTLQPVRLELSRQHLPVLLAVFRAPHSYTGQDMAELQLPGNPALLERVMHRAIELGARLAEAGEFTFRAYLSGKLDLTQAEGVAATIAANSEGQLHAARLLRDGELGRFASSLVDELGTQLALTEAGIDFVDQEDVVPIHAGDLLANVEVIAKRLRNLLAHSRAWSELEALPRVVLVGAPSTGKSSLFNALLGRHRAVISPMPGTTRDILAEPLALTPTLVPGSSPRSLPRSSIAPTDQPIEVMLVDMAGIDSPQTALDHDVQSAARRSIEQADLILHTNDGSADERFDFTATNAPVIRVGTKADLDRNIPKTHLLTSAHTGNGIAQLKQAIVERIGERAVSVSAEMLALTPRHEAALRASADHLNAAVELLEPQRRSKTIINVELVAGTLRAALDELAALGGTLTPEDVLGRIFSSFCIGK